MTLLGIYQFILGLMTLTLFQGYRCVRIINCKFFYIYFFSLVHFSLNNAWLLYTLKKKKKHQTQYTLQLVYVKKKKFFASFAFECESSEHVFLVCFFSSFFLFFFVQRPVSWYGRIYDLYIYLCVIYAFCLSQVIFQSVI